MAPGILRGHSLAALHARSAPAIDVSEPPVCSSLHSFALRRSNSLCSSSNCEVRCCDGRSSPEEIAAAGCITLAAVAEEPELNPFPTPYSPTLHSPFLTPPSPPLHFTPALSPPPPRSQLRRRARAGACRRVGEGCQGEQSGGEMSCTVTPVWNRDCRESSSTESDFAG